METNININQFSPNQLEFIDWVATPEFAREIKTQKEFAKKYELAEATLSRWKKRVDINEAIEQRKRERMRADVLPKILDSLAVRASRVGNEYDLKAANTAAEILLKWLYGEKFSEGMNLNITNQNIQQDIKEEKKYDLSVLTNEELNEFDGIIKRIRFRTNRVGDREAKSRR
jgi:hypothetical protein